MASGHRLLECGSVSFIEGGRTWQPSGSWSVHQQGHQLTQSAFSRAASRGHLTIVKYFRLNEVAWPSDIDCQAAGQGQLEVLQYLYAHRCPQQASACFSAAANGHLEVLDHLHSMRDILIMVGRRRS